MEFNSGFKGLIDKHLFGGSFLPVDIGNYEPRYPATVPSIAFNQTDLIEVSYCSVGTTLLFSQTFR